MGMPECGRLISLGNNTVRPSSGSTLPRHPLVATFSSLLLEACKSIALCFLSNSCFATTEIGSPSPKSSCMACTDTQSNIQIQIWSQNSKVVFLVSTPVYKIQYHFVTKTL